MMIPVYRLLLETQGNAPQPELVFDQECRRVWLYSADGQIIELTHLKGFSWQVGMKTNGIDEAFRLGLEPERHSYAKLVIDQAGNANLIRCGTWDEGEVQQ